MAFVAAMRFALLLSLFAMPTRALYMPDSFVKVYDAAGFSSEITSKPGLHLVQFFQKSSSQSQDFVPEYEKTAKLLNGVVSVVATDDKHLIEEYSVTVFPTVKVLSVTDGSTQVVHYTGSMDSAAIVKFALQNVKKIVQNRMDGANINVEAAKSSKKSSSKEKKVIVLTDENFNEIVFNDADNAWFVEFYAPWCGHCKALAPTWDRLPAKVEGPVKIAKVDATSETALASRFSIRGYPTLKFLPQGKKTMAKVVNYDGGRSEKDLLAFIKENIKIDSKVVQLVSQEQFDESCAKGVCLISILPHILDSKVDGRNKYLSILNSLAAAPNPPPVKLLWTQGGDHFGVEKKLNLAFGYPAVIAVNLEKELFIVHRGDFSQESLSIFMNGLMTGDSSVQPINGKLQFNTVQPWDGKEGKSPDEL